jgi:hypothetical protein
MVPTAMLLLNAKRFHFFFSSTCRGPHNSKCWADLLHQHANYLFVITPHASLSQTTLFPTLADLLALLPQGGQVARQVKNTSYNVHRYQKSKFSSLAQFAATSNNSLLKLDAFVLDLQHQFPLLYTA